MNRSSIKLMARQDLHQRGNAPVIQGILKKGAPKWPKQRRMRKTGLKHINLTEEIKLVKSSHSLDWARQVVKLFISRLKMDLQTEKL